MADLRVLPVKFSQVFMRLLANDDPEMTCLEVVNTSLLDEVTRAEYESGFNHLNGSSLHVLVEPEGIECMVCKCVPVSVHA